METPKERRQWRIDNWEKNFFVQLAKKVDINIEGNYFDYISDNENWKGQATYKENYKGKEIVITLSKYQTEYTRYPSWCYIELEGSRREKHGSHKCKNVDSAVKFIKSMVKEEKIKRDIIESRTKRKAREEELFSKLLTRKCLIHNSVENDDFENSQKSISCYTNIREKYIRMYVKESPTKLMFKINGLSEPLTSKQVVDLIAILESTK